MKKSPVKQQKQRDIDSLANVAYEKWYAKNVQNKKDALERMKYDETHLQRDESLPVYNTQSTNILKGTGIKGKFVQKFKDFSSKVKNFLSAHRNRFKEQSDIPMPRFGEDPKN